MKNTAIIFALILLQCVCSRAQIIKKINCSRVEEDSISLNYIVDVKFDSPLMAEKRMDLIKAEVERICHILPGQIIAIREFGAKRPWTYRYKIQVKKANG
jgi:hypothetical protein